MLLTELVEAVVEHLNDDTSLWYESDITVTAELDPLPKSIKGLRVFIVPKFVLPVLEPKARGSRQQLTEVLYFDLLVAKEFAEVPEENTEGVANWATEAKEMVDVWQRAQAFICKYQAPNMTLEDVEPREPEPLEMDLRKYVAMTTFGYHQVICDSEHEFTSMSTASTDVTVLQGIRASIRSRHSSGSKQDRA